jgi:hypothetical protein
MGSVVEAVGREDRLAQQHRQLRPVVVGRRGSRKGQRGILNSDVPSHRRAGDGDATNGHVRWEEVAGHRFYVAAVAEAARHVCHAQVAAVEDATP